MASLSSVPDPVDPDPGLKPQDSSTTDAPNSGAAPKRRVLGLLGRVASKPEQGWKVSSPFQPQIAVPASRSYEREEPAVDIDEHRSRSTQYANEDAIDVEATKLRCLNAWIRMRVCLFEGDPDAQEPERRQPLLARESFGIQKLAQISQAAGSAREAAAQLPASDPEDRKAAKGRRDAIERANRLTHRAMEIRYRLNTITDEIDTAARRVHDEIAGIIGHFFLQYEMRAERDKDIIGVWRSREAAHTHAEIIFAEEFGAPPVPTIEEIEELIKAARDRHRADPTAVAQ